AGESVREIFDKGDRPRRWTARASRRAASCYRPGVGELEPTAPRPAEEGRSAHPRLPSERAQEVRQEGRQKAVPILQTIRRPSRQTKREGVRPSLFYVYSYKHCD